MESVSISVAPFFTETAQNDEKNYRSGVIQIWVQIGFTHLLCDPGQMLFKLIVSQFSHL